MTTATGARSVAGTDDFAQALEADRLLTSAQAKRLQAWWRQAGRPGEDVMRFLTRHDVLNPEARQTYQMIRRGYFSVTDLRVLFAPGGLELLKSAAGPAAAAAVSNGTDNFVVTPVDEMESAAEPMPTRQESRQAAPANPDKPRSIGPGTCLGRCLLIEEIGRGTCGRVYRALHQGLNIPVAVKVLPEHGDADGLNLSQLKTEAQLLARLDHPNVVRVLDFDEERVPFLVLELVQWLSLMELIEQSGGLRIDRAADIIRGAARGLLAASEAGLIHRDVKPANILVNRSGRPKVADLGLAVVKAEAADGVGRAGTAAYMAPEQATRNAVIDHRADIYALGATFYHAVTGRMPFTGRSPNEVLMKHAGEPLTPPDAHVPGLPAAASRVIGRMMAKKPEGRHADYYELLADMDDLPQPADPKRRPRDP